jgi:hypothetical protein
MASAKCEKSQRLAKTRGDVDQWAVLYGWRGQKQEGIDILARRADAKSYSCWQSKRHRRLTSTSLKAAIAELEKGEWAAKSDESIVCSSAPIQDAKLRNEIEAQRNRLRSKNLNLEVIGQAEISEQLKTNSKSSGTFGRDFVRHFCIDHDETELSESLAHVPEKACPGLDLGWAPVFRKGHAQTQESRAHPGSS